MPIAISDFVKMPDAFKDIIFIVVIGGAVSVLDYMGIIKGVFSLLGNFLGYNIYYERGLFIALSIVILFVGFLQFMGFGNK